MMDRLSQQVLHIMVTLLQAQLRTLFVGTPRKQAILCLVGLAGIAMDFQSSMKLTKYLKLLTSVKFYKWVSQNTISNAETS
jgi:hypothetical protein